MAVEIITPTERTCQNCKHWGRGFNATVELNNLTWAKKLDKLNRLKKLFAAYPFRREDKCQKKENEKTETHTVYVGVFTQRTEVFQRPTTKDWFCPLWEKLEPQTIELKLSFEDWFKLKQPDDKKVYDISLEGCKIADNKYLIDTRKERIKYSIDWLSDKITEEKFDRILLHCIIKDKKWYN